MARRVKSEGVIDGENGEGRGDENPSGNEANEKETKQDEIDNVNWVEE